MNKLNITNYNQIERVSLYIKTTNGIQEVEFKGNNGITTFRSLMNRLEAKYTGNGMVVSQPKKIVIDDNFSESKPAKTTVMKKRVKKIQQPEELDYIENVDDVYDPEEDFENFDADLKIGVPQPKNPNEINLNRSNVLNLSYTPASGEMSATQAGKLMASQSGFGFKQ